MTDQPKPPTNPTTPAVGSRVRSGLVWFGSRSRSTSPEIEPLIRALRANHPRADVTQIERAYETAARQHEGQFRKSGEPYITHPVAVATILAEMGMTVPTLVAALLHDTVEDTDYTLEQLTDDFGENIALLVDGVTKLDRIHYGKAAQSETLRKMIVAMSHDVRVLLIKLGDRLHNARTWRFVGEDSAKRKAQETLEIYAPLAHRLGINTIKWELEELSFQILYPEIYAEIDRLVSERTPERETYLRDVIGQIQEDLRHTRIKGSVGGRPKNHYSIYQKMVVRGKAFNEIFDLVAVRVLVDSVKDCYAVLGALHGRWNPIPGRFKDYIAMPKFNFYQSLHTTVIGPGGKPVEIQIRTREMHEHAENGIAAHWKYKQGPDSASNEQDQMTSGEQMSWLRSLVDMERETGDPEEFLDSLRFEIVGDEVYVFTPRGEVVVLPAHSTPVDLAYAVHTEVGHRTVGARVNGKLVSLNTPLESGQVVEIITSKSAKASPSRDWLAFVASPRAKSKIKSWFSKERRDEAMEKGKERLAQVMRKENLPLQRLMNHESIFSVANELGFQDVSSLYTAVGEGQLPAQRVISVLVQALGGGDGTEETLAEAVPLTVMPSRMANSEIGVTVEGMNDTDIWVKLAKCCSPVPGDPIVGFITRGQGVSVHHATCLNASRLEEIHPERFVDVSWNTHGFSARYRLQIELRALDRPALLSDVTSVFAEYKVNILATSAVSSLDQVASLRFTFEIAEMSHLSAILSALRRLDGVFEVNRMTGTEQRSRS